MSVNQQAIPNASAGQVSNEALQAMITSSHAMQNGEIISDEAAHLLLLALPQLLQELSHRRQRMTHIQDVASDTTNVTFLPTAAH